MFSPFHLQEWEMNHRVVQNIDVFSSEQEKTYLKKHEKDMRCIQKTWDEEFFESTVSPFFHVCDPPVHPYGD